MKAHSAERRHAQCKAKYEVQKRGKSKARCAKRNTSKVTKFARGGSETTLPPMTAMYTATAPTYAMPSPSLARSGHMDTHARGGNHIARLGALSAVPPSR